MEDEKMLLTYLEHIVRQNNVLIEQCNTLSKVLAKHLNLAVEEGVVEYEAE